MGEPAPVKKAVVNQPNINHKRLRLITATSLFDGHDAAINIMRRMLQSRGVEVIHLGHNRSVNEVVHAALQEDADGIAVSCYQGGHMEYYQYMVDQLKQMGADSIKVFGGGGGVIQQREIEQLHDYGVTRIYSPEDGQRLGLPGMINDLIKRCGQQSSARNEVMGPQPIQHTLTLARTLSLIENATFTTQQKRKLALQARVRKHCVAVVGITGPGGAGKSSLADELIRLFRLEYQDTLNIAIIAVDPTRAKSRGALLGDRLRMNAINTEKVFMRSVATRSAGGEIPECLGDMVNAMIADHFDLVIVETAGSGQGDIGIVDYVDLCLYVMTSEFGAATQLEKLSMLDYADLVAINKFDRKGSQDALHDVQKQLQRNREQFSVAPRDMPVFGTIAAKMNDPGLSTLFLHLCDHLQAVDLLRPQTVKPIQQHPTHDQPILPVHRQHYLNQIAKVIRVYRQRVETNAEVARSLQQHCATQAQLGEKSSQELADLIAATQQRLDKSCHTLLEQWLSHQENPDADDATFTSLSGTSIPKVARPQFHDHGDILKWIMLENLPGRFPFTAGVFPSKRSGEVPTRMFAGEGDPLRTNRRFKYLASHGEALRLSTAFDSVTLYGCDPDRQPDIYGKVGNSGVSVATLDDIKVLYDGFDLCDPKTSVSMTINGPAPTLLAMFFNCAIDQQVDCFRNQHQREPDADEYLQLQSRTLQSIRGTVQADILKEDQGQNTCIFSTEFSLKVMGDIQEYFIDNDLRHFYSISVSGYHIAEAGANPITQLAFTLANGFTYVEAFLARGMAIDDFAHRLSFFFSNGMDPEYTVIGRVARRIWAIALREYYHAGERSQKLKYHIQTSGRSLHAQALDFNEIRTTLQALIAVYDNCNSLHTNAKDEALTTPSEETVRQALAIQMIIDKEWGLANNENPNQGSFIIEQLTDLVERAVLNEFERLSERGGVLGAMETGYQRNQIQDQSLLYEAGKHDGSIPIVGVNLYQSDVQIKPQTINLARSTSQEKNRQIERIRQFKVRHSHYSEKALEQLKRVVINQGNVFTELMKTVRVCSLGEITNALYEVGGRYRRNM